MLDRTELGADRFVRNAGRVQYRDEMMTLLAYCFVQWKRTDLLAALKEAGVPSSPINSIPEALADPQIRHRGIVIDIPHREAGRIRQVASQLRLSETPIVHDRPPPALGEHTVQILQEIGFDGPRIESLRQSGVV